MMKMMPTTTTPDDNPTLHVSPWHPYLDPTALPNLTAIPVSDEASGSDDEDLPMDAFSSDDFRMYEFKIRRCTRSRSHDWTDCPFAHPGEKARRRDPRKHAYSGTPCPDFKKGGCKRLDSCEFAHGVFECWLHPSRYRTQPCKEGTACRRRVCFFAHTPDQLRILPSSPTKGSGARASFDSYDGSPLRLHGGDAAAQMIKGLGLSLSLSSGPESAPVSPNGGEMLRRASWSGRSERDIIEAIKRLRIGRVNSAGRSGWDGGVFGLSPTAMTGFLSLPSTPTRFPISEFDGGLRWGEEIPMERVESGRALRARMFEKLSKDGLGERSGAVADV